MQMFSLKGEKQETASFPLQDSIVPMGYRGCHMHVHICMWPAIQPDSSGEQFPQLPTGKSMGGHQ